MDLSEISHKKVVRVIKKLKRRKAVGIDNIQAEVLQALLSYDKSIDLLAFFFSECWRQKSTPLAWHGARVSAIFKKGDPALCSNYRPISFLCIIYKVFAAIMLERLISAGAAERVWSTQFGFRPGSGTANAFFLVRRIIDRLYDNANLDGILLALD